MGSSSSSRSGRDSSSRHSATRRRSPPDSVVTSASPGGRRSASMAISVVRVEVPGAGGLDLGLQVGLAGAELLVVGIGVGPAGHDLVVLGEQGGDLADAVHHVALHVLGRVELGLLLQHPDGEPGREPGVAGEAVVHAGHDPQQRRLAGPVGARARRSWRPGKNDSEMSFRTSLSGGWNRLTLRMVKMNCALMVGTVPAAGRRPNPAGTVSGRGARRPCGSRGGCGCGG